MSFQLEYKRIGGFEAYGNTTLGVQIYAGGDLPKDMDHEIIWRAIYKAEDLIKNALYERQIAEDPKSEEQAKKEREQILGCFPEDMKIFVEEIPNGYGDMYYLKHLPWFIVTTPKGRIKIGWRKRVIEIDWSDSPIKEDSEDLFDDEDVTKGHKSIHAWSVDKAKEYIAKILAD